MPAYTRLVDVPSLQATGYEITSPQAIYYNCIAWAAGESDRWWWPVISPTAYWPPGVPRETSVAAFEAAFQTLGYVGPATSELESDVEKVAIYVGADGDVTHMARQLPDGSWTSKCGRLEDIRHPHLDSLVDVYGKAVRFLRRARPSR